MKNYSIIPMLTDNIEEICQDIKFQYETHVADLALFSMTLVPEGNPVEDKASIFCEKYDLFRDRLKEMGYECGILVQATIGHGYPLNNMFPFQQCVNLTDGEAVARCCPYDQKVREHFRDVFEIVASHKPKTIMVDDDMRLLYHFGKGCACPLHMAEFNKRAGTDITREELYEIVMDKSHKDCYKFREIFEQIQDDSLCELAEYMREGIDRVDPTIGASICSGGTDPHGKIAKILAGKHNPSIMRVNNGFYSTPGARNLSLAFYMAALQMHLECNEADIYLAETDTCPQNRYSTSAHFVHSHFTGTILEGASGAKHWITRMIEFEPESGKAYRDVLSKHAGMHEALSQINRSLKWRGCNIPLPKKMPFAFDLPPFYHPRNTWSTNVLERLGLPLYFSPEANGAVFFDDEYDKCFENDVIEEYFKGTVCLSAVAAQRLIKRGFGKYIGVDVREWTGKSGNEERILVNGKKCNKQHMFKELLPKDDSVETLSYMLNRNADGETENLFPSVTRYKNSLGGTTIVFCGTPDAPFHYTTGFGLLTYSRKQQFIDILKKTGNLPVYYPEDAEVYLKAADMPDGKLFCAVFNISMDPIEKLPLCFEKDINNAWMMSPEGNWEEVSYIKENDTYIFDTPANILTPVILKFA